MCHVNIPYSAMFSWEKPLQIIIRNKILVSKTLVNIVHSKCLVVEISRHYMSELNTTMVHVMYMFMMESVVHGYNDYKEIFGYC